MAKPKTKTSKSAPKASKPKATPTKIPVSKRVENIRDAIAEASTGLSDEEYTELFETLISDADGWRDDLSERAAEQKPEEPLTSEPAQESAATQ